MECGVCEIHIATLEKDPVKQLEMRRGVVRVCKEEYRMDLRLEDVTDCDGCSVSGGRLFSGCATCEIWKCAIGRGLASCASCVEYACDRLLKHFKTDPQSRARLEALRKS